MTNPNPNPAEPLSDAALADLERWVAFHVEHHSDTRMEVFPHKIAAVLSRLRLAEAARDELEEHIRSMIEECEQTLTWRNTRGMKTAGDSSDFASVSQSGVIRLKHSLRNALDCAARAAEEDTRP